MKEIDLTEECCRVLMEHKFSSLDLFLSFPQPNYELLDFMTERVLDVLYEVC